MVFYFDEGERAGEITIENYEKLIIESSYTEEEWNEFVSTTYWIYSKTENKYYISIVNKELLETKNDTIYVCDFTEFAVAFDKAVGMALGIEETKEDAQAETAVAAAAEEEKPKKGLAKFFQNLFGKKKKTEE
jgi:hypothetical protein